MTSYLGIYMSGKSFNFQFDLRIVFCRPRPGEHQTKSSRFSSRQQQKPFRAHERFSGKFSKDFTLNSNRRQDARNVDSDLVFMAVCRCSAPPTRGSSILFHSLQSDRGGGDQRTLGWSQDAPGQEGTSFFCIVMFFWFSSTQIIPAKDMSYLDILNNYIEYNGNSSIACLKNRAHKTKNDLLVKLDPQPRRRKIFCGGGEERRRKRRIIQGGTWKYWVSMRRYGKCSVVLGQYQAVVVDTWLYW